MYVDLLAPKHWALLRPLLSTALPLEPFDCSSAVRRQNPTGLNVEGQLAMAQKPNRTPSEHPNPTTKIGSKIGGAPKTPKTVPLVLTTTASWFLSAGPPTSSLRFYRWEC